MRIPKRMPICALSCAMGVFFTLTQAALTQSDVARLQGTIVDQSNAVVPGAEVKITNKSTSLTQRTTTDNAQGTFSFQNLPPGNYELQVSKTGFQTLKQPLTLEVAQNANVRLTLPTGQITQEVVVSDTPALVDSVSSDMGTTVQTKEIEELPLNG